MISEVSESTPLGKSDHAVLHFKLSCYKDFPQEEFVEKFKYDKGDYEAIQDDLSKINWEDELDTQTVDDAWNVFTNHFTATMDKNIPKTKPPKQKVGGKKWKPLWMSKGKSTCMEKIFQYQAVPGFPQL